jgi:hypothetical protein
MAGYFLFTGKSFHFINRLLVSKALNHWFSAGLLLAPNRHIAKTEQAESLQYLKK